MAAIDRRILLVFGPIGRLLISELYCYLAYIGRLLTSEFCCYFHMYEKCLWQSKLRISCNMVQCLLLT